MPDVDARRRDALPPAHSPATNLAAASTSAAAEVLTEELVDAHYRRHLTLGDDLALLDRVAHDARGPGPDGLAAAPDSGVASATAAMLAVLTGPRRAALEADLVDTDAEELEAHLRERLWLVEVLEQAAEAWVATRGLPTSVEYVTGGVTVPNVLIYERRQMTLVTQMPVLWAAGWHAALT